jgi:uncharacterized protein (DUF2267 family)
MDKGRSIMADTGLPIFDETLHVTNRWLNEIEERLGCTKQQAYHALRAGLHAVRDRLTAVEAVHLSAQLPLLIRGIYFEGWRPTDNPGHERPAELWLVRVEEELRDANIDAQEAAKAVFGLLKAHCDAGELKHVHDQLPAEVREMMEAA